MPYPSNKLLAFSAKYCYIGAMEYLEITKTRAKVLAVKGRWRELERRSSVSYSWINQFARGVIKNPTVESLRRVEEACDALMGS